MNQSDLITERDTLQSKLNWLGVKSTGSERIKKRLEEIEREIGALKYSFKAPE